MLWGCTLFLSDLSADSAGGNFGITRTPVMNNVEKFEGEKLRGCSSPEVRISVSTWHLFTSTARTLVLHKTLGAANGCAPAFTMGTNALFSTRDLGMLPLRSWRFSSSGNSSLLLVPLESGSFDTCLNYERTTVSRNAMGDLIFKKVHKPSKFFKIQRLTRISKFCTNPGHVIGTTVLNNASPRQMATKLWMHLQYSKRWET